MSDSLRPHGLQHARRLCPPPSPWVCSNSCPLNQWRYLIISSCATPFSFCLPSFPAWESFPIHQLLASGGQSAGASASSSVYPMNIQGWLPLRLTGLISLQSKELSRVLFSPSVRKYQFFVTQPSEQSRSYIHTLLLLLSLSVLSNSLWPHGLQHTRFPCSSQIWSFLKLRSTKWLRLSGGVSFVEEMK